jgi:hypothetical protein
VKHLRQKRLLLGWLALLVPWPLPFNTVVGWASVALYLIAVAVFLMRSADDRLRPLPYWAMNMLGLAYIPLLVLDLTVLRQGRILQPLVHLAMFTLVVKLFGMRREKEKWHIFLTIFFLFVAAAGTSVHPSVFLYLVAFLFSAILVLMRFAGLHAVAEHRRQETMPASVPLRRLAAGTVAMVVVGSAPIFFLLPRLRQPYIWAPTAGAGSSAEATGFSDRLDLDVIGRVRSSRAVKLRFAYDTPVPMATERRFKAAAFDRYDNGVWRRTPRPALSIGRSRDGLFHLAEERSAAWMSVWQRTAADGKVVLPVEARAVELAGNGLALDEAGVASFMLPQPGTVQFRVGMGRSPFVPAPTPDLFFGDVPELDRSGISPEIEALAAEVMGEGEPLVRARRAQEYLLANYSYSLDLGAQPGERPVERFLFETRSGQTEYFVSALVLMLRSQGIPARLVTGYLGADFNEWQRYFVVRQSHAHAWVETFLDEDGWRVLDPTPPAGRPAGATTGLTALLGQAWDSMLFRWDRYVLTYGFYDQVGFFIQLRDLLERFWGSLGRDRGGSARSESPALEEAAPAAAEAGAEPLAVPSWLFAVPLGAALGAVLAWLWWRRTRFDATEAYRLLRARLDRAAGPSRESLPPLEVERRLGESFPAAAAETRFVVRSYLEESFGGRRLSEVELRRVREAVRRVRGPRAKSA